MALYRYVKGGPPATHRKRSLSIGFIVMGIGLLLWTIWPIISFSVIAETLFTNTVTPVTDAGRSLENSQAPVDYTNANVWYPMHPQKKINVPIATYTLSIPKLRIEDAVVTIAGDSLDESLIHYGGTPLPGENGNTVIFGHSTLPQFYNPKSYKTIFSLVPTLKPGDKIYITYDNVQYTYTIYDMVVVDPTDLTPLAQRFDDSFLTIVTCVPPGTYWKRLNVRAKLDREGS